MKNTKRKIAKINREIENALCEGFPVLLIAFVIILFYSLI